MIMPAKTLIAAAAVTFPVVLDKKTDSEDGNSFSSITMPQFMHL